MNCPKCKKEMKVQAEHESENSRDGKKYAKVVYWCEADDIWMTTEIPK
jgi:hypothetical protein